MAEEIQQPQQPQQQITPIGHQFMLSRKDPTLIMQMVHDDSPKTLKEELPEYFNDETALTHFDEKDRKIEMCYHDISMLSKLKEQKLRNFNGMKFIDVEKKTLWFGQCPTCEFKTFDRNIQACPTCSIEGNPAGLSWSGAEFQSIVSELSWVTMFHRSRPKVFVKTTRAKNGFTYNGLTMEKSEIKQSLSQPGMQGPVQEPKKKRFSLF